MTVCHWKKEDLFGMHEMNRNFSIEIAFSNAQVQTKSSCNPKL